MDYIVDARKYLPDFLHKSNIMSNIMDCINALISNDQPIFGEIKGAYDDMLYRCSDYSKLTYQAKVNIIRELGFDYIIDVLNFSDDKLTSLLTFFELIYNLKGKEEGLRLCLDHILSSNKISDPIIIKKTDQQIILKASYLSDILGELIIDDLIITLKFYKNEEMTSVGYVSGELIFNNKKIYINQEIINIFEDNTPINFTLVIEKVNNELYELNLVESESLIQEDSSHLCTLDLSQYVDQYNNLQPKYNIQTLIIKNPTNWINNEEQLSLYTYTPWDRMEPKGQEFTATLTITGNEFSDPKVFKKLTTFIRSYILPWVEIDIVLTIDIDAIYISPIFGLLAEECDDYINTSNATAGDIATYDVSYYDQSPSGKKWYYGTSIASGPNEVERNKFDNTFVEIKVQKYDSETRTNKEVTDQSDIYIGIYKERYDEDTQTLITEIEYEKTNYKEVEKFMPIMIKAEYNGKIKEYKYVPNGERIGDLAQIITFY